MWSTEQTIHRNCRKCRLCLFRWLIPSTMIGHLKALTNFLMTISVPPLVLVPTTCHLTNNTHKASITPPRALQPYTQSQHHQVPSIHSKKSQHMLNRHHTLILSRRSNTPSKTALSDQFPIVNKQLCLRHHSLSAPLQVLRALPQQRLPPVPANRSNQVLEMNYQSDSPTKCGTIADDITLHR
jgi:hypothetical protein